MNENDIAILLPILKGIPLFSSLDQELHREIISRIVLMYYPENYKLFDEGDEGDALYIIKRGAVKIFHPEKDEDESIEHVAEIHDGGFFGEMALISDLPRNASAKTILDSEIFILGKSDFKNLIATNQQLAEQISATVVARINENNKRD